MTTRSLEDLFAAFLATGEEIAFEQLMRRSAPELRRLARRLGASAEDAEDLLQETMVAAIQAADRYDPRRALLPWLKGILTFRACRLARAETRRRRGHAAAPVDATVDPIDLQPSATEQLAGLELGADVDHAIDDLPARYREPLRQFLLAERSPVEIARDLGVERATLRVQLHRGLQRLRDRLRQWRHAMILCFGVGAERLRRRVAVRPLAAIGLGVIALVIAITWCTAAPAPRRTALADSPTDVAAAAIAPPGDVAATASEPTPERNRHSVSATTTHLHVLVRDADGAPVAHVGLALAPARGRDPVLHRRRAVTDSHGRALFDRLAPDQLRLCADRGSECTFVLLPGDNDQELRVDGGIGVRGRVVDALGRPAGAAQVWLSSDASAPWHGCEVATTDAAGRFALANVPIGAFVIARHDDFSDGELHRCTIATDTDLQLQLGDRGGRAQIVVRDGRGAPVADALVFVGEAMDAAPLWLAQGAAPWRRPPVERRTDAHGQVTTLALAPGSYPVFVRAIGMAPHTGTVTVAAGAIAELVVTLRRGGALRGRVLDATGNARADADVVFRCADPTASIDVTTDAAGAFVFECAPPGEGEVAARAPDCVPRAVPVVVDASSTDELVLQLAGARRIRGRVRADGASIAATLRADWPDTALAEPRAETAIAADGTFVLTDATATAPSLSLRIDGEPMWRRIDACSNWSGNDVTVQLPPAFAATSWLAGRLSCHDGAPLARARLFVHGADGWAEIGRSDAQGTFRLGPLPAGTFELFAETTTPDLPTLPVGTFRLAPGERRDVDMTAPATGTLELEFARTDGGAIGDLAVTLVGKDLDRRFAAATGGRLRQVLLPGDYYVFAMGSHVRWLERYGVHVDADAVTRRHIELTAGRRCSLSLRGLPRAATAAPLRFRLSATSGAAWSATYTLAADAPMRLAAVLADGSYQLEHRDAAGRPWIGTFAVAGTGCDDHVVVDLAPR